MSSIDYTLLRKFVQINQNNNEIANKITPPNQYSLIVENPSPTGPTGPTGSFGASIFNFKNITNSNLSVTYPKSNSILKISTTKKMPIITDVNIRMFKRIISKTTT